MLDFELVLARALKRTGRTAEPPKTLQ